MLGPIRASSCTFLIRLMYPERMLRRSHAVMLPQQLVKSEINASIECCTVDCTGLDFTGRHA